LAILIKAPAAIIGLELEKLRKRGATHLVFTEYTAWWLEYYKEFGSYLDSHYRRLSQTPQYVIFDVSDGVNTSVMADESPIPGVDN